MTVAASDFEDWRRANPKNHRQPQEASTAERSAASGPRAVQSAALEVHRQHGKRKQRRYDYLQAATDRASHRLGKLPGKQNYTRPRRTARAPQAGTYEAPSLFGRVHRKLPRRCEAYAQRRLHREAVSLHRPGIKAPKNQGTEENPPEPRLF